MHIYFNRAGILSSRKPLRKMEVRKKTGWLGRGNKKVQGVRERKMKKSDGNSG